MSNACPDCGGQRKAIVSENNPAASEYYCEACHKSTYMSGEQSRKETFAQSGS